MEMDSIYVIVDALDVLGELADVDLPRTNLAENRDKKPLQPMLVQTSAAVGVQVVRVQVAGAQTGKIVAVDLMVDAYHDFGSLDNRTGIHAYGKAEVFHRSE